VHNGGLKLRRRDAADFTVPINVAYSSFSQCRLELIVGMVTVNLKDIELATEDLC
jgi:hypothetical protein